MNRDELQQAILDNRVELDCGELWLPQNPGWYTNALPEVIKNMTTDETLSLYRFLAKHDLYFLARFVLSSRVIKFPVKDGLLFWEHPWIFNRAREVQLDSDGNLDLWFRGAGKSMLITCSLTIQNLMNNPELTFGLFSNTRPLAKNFLRQIKVELETNEDLKKLAPEIFWQDPKKESPKWSEDEGIVIKRESNPREASIEAWGVLDGMPTGKHYDIRVYDDVIEESTVTNPEMVEKATRQWELSTNLGKPGGKARYIGTRYAFHDLYHTIIERGVARPRIRAALDPPSLQEGEPVFFTKEFLVEKFDEQGPFTFAAQQLLNPVAESVIGFNPDWLNYYTNPVEEVKEGLNIYIMVDPATQKKKTSDYTAIMVVGLGADGNYYILDMIRDRLNPQERIDALFTLHMLWKPLQVRYEQYGMQSDIAYIQYVQNHRNYRFAIEEVGGKVAKEDRIQRLIPIMKEGKFYCPESLYRVDYQGRDRDLMKDFRFEMESFPVGLHDDMLDALARIAEPKLPLVWPQEPASFPQTRRDRWLRVGRPREVQRSWLSA